MTGLIKPLLLVSIMLLSACQITPKSGRSFPKENLVDGTYEAEYKGGPNSVKVSVTVLEGKIQDISILAHDASWIGRKADSVVVARMIERESADVDAVSGATNSSHVIMNAVQLAIEKAIAVTDTGKLF